MDGNQRQFLSDQNIKNIRTKFYETNARLFINYNDFIRVEDGNNINLDVMQFMEQDLVQANFGFYHGLFKNENYVEDDSNVHNPKNSRYIVRQQYLMSYIESTFEVRVSYRANKNEKNIEHFMQTILHIKGQMQKDQNKKSQEEKNAKLWLEDETKILKEPIIVDFKFKAGDIRLNHVI